MTAEGLAGSALDLARKHEEKLRFLVVGVFNTAISYVMFAGWYFALGAFDLGALRYNIALVASWIVGVVISYTNFKLWVFRTRGTNWLAELGRSYIVYSAGLLVNLGVLNFFVSFLHVHPLVGQFMSIFVVTVMSFLGHKYFTFGNRHVADESDIFEEPSAE